MSRHSSEQAAFYGHHKCASSWVRQILETLCASVRLPCAGFDNPSQFGGDLPRYVRDNPGRLISFTNAAIEYVRPLGEHRAFHLVRDPRDVLVSAYFSHLKTHQTDGWPELGPHRRRLEGLSKEEGLLAELEFSECYLRQMAEWDYDQPNVKEMKFEAFTQTPCDHMLAALDWIGLLNDADFTVGRRIEEVWNAINTRLHALCRSRFPRIRVPRRAIPAYRVLWTTHERRFERLSRGRAPGEEDAGSHYRKGVSGDWANHFTPRVEVAFHERYPNILERTGYPAAQ